VSGGGVYVFRADGSLERHIRTGDPDTTNCAFDGGVLYFTQASTGSVATMKWDVPGMPLFPAPAG
jgi:sugar lactone lactonase YvrE